MELQRLSTDRSRLQKCQSPSESTMSLVSVTREEGTLSASQAGDPPPRLSSNGSRHRDQWRLRDWVPAWPG